MKTVYSLYLHRLRKAQIGKESVKKDAYHDKRCEAKMSESILSLGLCVRKQEFREGGKVQANGALNEKLLIY